MTFLLRQFPKQSLVLNSKPFQIVIKKLIYLLAVFFCKYNYTEYLDDSILN